MTTTPSPYWIELPDSTPMAFPASYTHGNVRTAAQVYANQFGANVEIHKRDTDYLEIVEPERNES